MQYIMRAKEGRGMAGFRVGFTVPVQVLDDGDGHRTVTIGRVYNDHSVHKFGNVESACCDLAGRIRQQMALLTQGSPADSAPPVDPIRQPAHYKSGALEAIDVIEGFDLSYRLGNVVKYVLRAGKKGEPHEAKAKKAEDLRKALQYLVREINAIEGNGKGWEP